MTNSNTETFSKLTCARQCRSSVRILTLKGLESSYSTEYNLARWFER